MPVMALELRGLLKKNFRKKNNAKMFKIGGGRKVSTAGEIHYKHISTPTLDPQSFLEKDEFG